MLNNKIILGLVFVLSFSLFIGSNYHAYAGGPFECITNSHHSGNSESQCVCDPGFVQNGVTTIGGFTGQPICIAPVGGFGIPIDSTALLLAGVQGSALWMIPAIVSAGAGITIFKLRKKKQN